MAEEQTLTREQLAEIEDERRRRAALAKSSSADKNMNQLNAQKKKNDAKHRRSHTILYLIGVLFMALTLGGMAMLIMSLKSS